MCGCVCCVLHEKAVRERTEGWSAIWQESARFVTLRQSWAMSKALGALHACVYCASLKQVISTIAGLQVLQELWCYKEFFITSSVQELSASVQVARRSSTGCTQPCTAGHSTKEEEAGVISILHSRHRFLCFRSGCAHNLTRQVWSYEISKQVQKIN